MAKILVIDDDKDILRLLDFAMKRAGHSVLTSLEGPEGLVLAQTERPDVIVADVMMPKMTGYDFCRQIRADPALKNIPIIIFSARFQPIDKQTAIEAGATDYLPKTNSPAVLINRIAELLPGAEVADGSQHAAIGLFSLRGGAGVTSLAVNLAVALARARQVALALVDLAPMGGHAALMLGLRPASSVAGILSNSTDRFTLDSIKPHLMQHKSGVYLLPSALSYDRTLLLNDARLAQLITTLKSGFPMTVLDIPQALEPPFAPTLQLFDKILLVLSADMPSLQSAALALQGLARLDIAENKIVLVANHVLPEGLLPIDVIQKVIKRPVSFNIPYESSMVKAVNNGTPLVLGQPQSAGAIAITRLAHTLIN